MKDRECMDFLQWCLPKLDLRWKGFRKVRKQVCKRVQRRYQQLNLPDSGSYRDYLDANPDEWHILDSLCYITVSRFYRNKKVFENIREVIFPELIRKLDKENHKNINAWSAGCCSGEEPYTLKLIWEQDIQPETSGVVNLFILATDIKKFLLNRARDGIFPGGSLKHLPEKHVRNGFIKMNNEFKIKERYKKNIRFEKQDIRKEIPEGPFHMIFCRNLVFTYFEKNLQQKILQSITNKLLPGSYLIIGSHESLPAIPKELEPYPDDQNIFVRKG
ncbi:MAG: chemotaxis protein CheR [Calditrichaeota bacterium]|nr:chemotaxis protein CheR [Calditrichota bacterium]RQW06450.1 MAG: chemotaxis protein CheR [Calditrichota bacterium]